MSDYQQLIDRLNTVLDRIEHNLPSTSYQILDQKTLAYRWRAPGVLKPVIHPHRIALDDLLNVNRQKNQLVQNTHQFVAGVPANNVLLWGSRGTGKSSLIKAMLGRFAIQGLRLIEVDRQDLIDLPEIVEPLYGRQEKFIIFSDDLSFASDDPSYKALKAMLDGSISPAPENVLIYATSNRRHLMPEFMKENLEARHVDGELHHGESVEEKISLSDRFGLWLAFYPFKQDQYLDTVNHWLRRLGVNPGDPDAVRDEALRWALARGSRSGRTAHQFARDLAGRLACISSPENPSSPER